MPATTRDFEGIVLNETPLIDVRAPIEFAEGAFINALNMPIMNDEERRRVGICYKEQGNEAATRLGYRLVAGEVKAERVAAWKAQLEAHPETLIYCFRGGQRSKISQEWIAEATGRDVPRLEGGYKAFRQYLIEQLSPEVQRCKPVLLGGCTGSGKTLLLREIKNFVDLEGIANHRGSSFGGYVSAQPTQIQFENDLAYRLVQHRAKGYEYLILEDEGNHVGRCFIPKPLATFIGQSDLVLLEVEIGERVDITYDEYVIQAIAAYSRVFGEEAGYKAWEDQIRNNIDRIKSRLGGDRHKQVLEMFEEASLKQKNQEGPQGHKRWVEALLEWYYDPMYRFQIEKRKSHVVFQGDTEAVRQYLADRYAPSLRNDR